ncbi:MAG: hypothetical protein U1E68_09085 [Sphingomonadaceae bacterium]
MDQINHSNGNTYDLIDGSFFHLTEASNSLVMHNARIGSGVLLSVSAIANMPGLAGAITSYAAFNSEQEKEAYWEKVRAASFSQLPSRLKSFYCFEDRSNAEAANKKWFNDDRAILELRIIHGSQIARVDTQWLNCNEEKWPHHSKEYWSGTMTNDPFVEIIVSGCMYFPDWKNFRLLGT